MTSKTHDHIYSVSHALGEKKNPCLAHSSLEDMTGQEVFLPGKSDQCKSMGRRVTLADDVALSLHFNFGRV